MAAFSLDSSCMVATVCSWHERHADAVAALTDRLDRGDALVIAAHALVETYSVLTRLPSPHRLAPADAWALVHANFVAHATLTALPSRRYVALLRQLADEGIGGGQSYDALIAESAARANAGELLTFNPRHFRSLPPGIIVIEPGAGS